MPNTEISFVAVSGYGWTGSGAVVDLLKEFHGYGTIDAEFRLIKDPHGIIDLETALLDNWEFIRHDTAIRDFLRFASTLSRRNNKYGQIGFDLSNKLSIDFLKESRSYIESLIEFLYSGRTMVHDYNLSSIERVLAKLKRRAKPNKSDGKLYFSTPTEEEFLYKTISYLKRIFENFATNTNTNKIVLDQAIPVTNINKSTRYFDNIKVILVDRDPRDIFAELHRQKALIGPELLKEDSADKYIKWHKFLRSKRSELDKDKVLQINFEDLILNYESTVRNIQNFLGDGNQHVARRTHFKPETSANNIGIWKKLKAHSQISEISRSLQTDCRLS